MVCDRRYEHYIRSLQRALQAHATPAVKQWFENYLKGAIPYYGVKTPQVKKLVGQWRKEERIAALSSPEQLALCKELMLLPHAEEKFASIIYLQMYLLTTIDSAILLDTAEWWFQEECFCDWSTADWFTVRVLASIIKRDASSVARIVSWRHAR